MSITRDNETICVKEGFSIGRQWVVKGTQYYGKFYAAWDGWTYLHSDGVVRRGCLPSNCPTHGYFALFEEVESAIRLHVEKGRPHE